MTDCESASTGSSPVSQPFPEECRAEPAESAEERTETFPALRSLRALRETMAYRSVLLGEQAVSKAAAQGSNPCAPACAGVARRVRHRSRKPVYTGANPVVGFVRSQKAEFRDQK
jgi:hypothetical protein